YDEPFADSSQIPTFLVSAMTRRHVTVALSGDGGDELFAGYNRYQLARRTWQAISLLPNVIRHGVAATLTSLSAERWSRLLSYLPARARPAQIGDKLHKLAAVLEEGDSDAIYRRLVSHWEPEKIAPGAPELRNILWDPRLANEIPELL